MLPGIPLTGIAFFTLLSLVSGVHGVAQTIVKNDNPLIYYHGRWDLSPGTWWAGSGFKLHIEGLSSLALDLGPHTTSPAVLVGVSVNYGPFNPFNVSAGANDIPLAETDLVDGANVIRINSVGWQNNRVNLESITLNPGARLVPYTPSQLVFQFIGDSLSAGQYLPIGVDQAWPFLTGEAFKAEHVVVAQPGAALSDIVSYGNVHGLSYEFFRTEDDGFYYTTDHNYTTPWDFKRDVPVATHVVIHIGANDSAQNVTADAFVDTYLKFVARLRNIYTHQPIFVFTPWGWPQPEGPNSYYYDGRYAQIVDSRHTMGDQQIFLVNTTGWVTYADVFPDNNHPDIAGHQKIAGLFENWLKNWGLKPQNHWATIA
ncbi:hypothetical protein BV25DRAFT_1855253 [Artomyces pyxidatus]|uniref:Uncharacterized protein n=1 Tax=Artomyces pyxidatus TaxID=48021 RepID=A0ACB8T3B4_9AGAM|nr:hypothetical protein BV25DRAFT_1855253 [Artomyces pyxidatus]